MSFYEPPVRSDELMHYGRLGMKWYQHIYGPLQSVSKYAKAGGTKIVSAKKKYDEGAPERQARHREKMIRSGNAKQIYKHKNEFTDDELRRANNRIAEDEKMRRTVQNAKNEKLRAKEQKRLAKEQKKLAKEQAKKNQEQRNLSDLINAMSTAANNVEKVYNAYDKTAKTIGKVRKEIDKQKPENVKKNDQFKKALSTLDPEYYAKNSSSLDQDQLKEWFNRSKTMNDINSKMSSLYKTDDNSGNNDKGNKGDKSNKNNNNDNNNNAISWTESDLEEIIIRVLEEQKERG